MKLIEQSICDFQDCLAGMCETEDGRRLALLYDGDEPAVVKRLSQGEDAGSLSRDGKTYSVKTVELNHANAEVVRKILPRTAPVPLGTTPAFGCGDRLGVAGPAHIRAVRERSVTPILAQQSIRELTRTERTADQVIDAATWAVLEEGYKGKWGADADHLKSEEDIQLTADAGFTMFTIDPGDHVCDSQSDASNEKGFADILQRCTRSVALRDTVTGYEFTLKMSEEDVKKGMNKYLRAVNFVDEMYQAASRIVDGEFDFEVSVDETDDPTSVTEHYIVASELRERGVRFTGLALRFIGEFEKGIDYKGDRDAFKETLKKNAAVARQLGGYKLSIHSGSDKFSIYPIFSECAPGLAHAKTAGTSYLEAIRSISMADPDFFREIFSYALGRYEEDKQTYHVSADLTVIPALKKLKDSELPQLLEDDNSRQVLHVSFGSVLCTRKENSEFLFRDRIYQALEDHRDLHLDTVSKHILRHLDGLDKALA